jgi:hypothetical protein
MSAQRRDLFLPAGLLVIQLGGLLSEPARWHVIFVVLLTLALAVPIVIVIRRIPGRIARHPARCNPGSGAIQTFTSELIRAGLRPVGYLPDFNALPESGGGAFGAMAIPVTARMKR